MSRCFARHNQPPYERCELEGGHDGLHQIVHSWGDDDVWEPTPGDVESIRMVPVLDVPMRQEKPAYAEAEKCITCGCVEAAHGPNGCARHLCRTFVA